MIEMQTLLNPANELKGKASQQQHDELWKAQLTEL
jgi:hypothetical protein